MRPDVLYTGISTYYYSPPAGMAGARRPPAYAAFLHPHPLRGWPHLRHMYCLGARGTADAEASPSISAAGVDSRLSGAAGVPAKGNLLATIGRFGLGFVRCVFRIVAGGSEQLIFF